MRCFLFLASTNCTISRDCWTNRRQGREVFLVLFFLYNDEVQSKGFQGSFLGINCHTVQYDIIEYLFSLDSLVGEDQQYQAMASVSGSPREGTVHAFKWWQTVAVEAILHLERLIATTVIELFTDMQTVIWIKNNRIIYFLLKPSSFYLSTFCAIFYHVQKSAKNSEVQFVNSCKGYSQVLCMKSHGICVKMH